MVKGEKMSKAILILDEVPHCCEMCYLCRIRTKGRYCVKTGKYDNNFGRVQKNCPIKLLPKKKKDYESRISHVDDYYEKGWNDCIDEILGEEDNEWRKENGAN